MEWVPAVPSCATWHPSDDTLLKNFVEEGVSLEALAKGAVHFSHPFSLQELHDRWHALLYNPEFLTEACAHLILDESKLKEISTSHRKRKVGTLRKRYYARLKRVRNNFFSSSNLEFLTDYNLRSCKNGGGFHDQETLHDGPQFGNSILEDCMPDPFVLQGTDFDVPQQNFLQVLTDLAPINGVKNQISETANNNSLWGLPAADSPLSVQGSGKIDGLRPFQSNNNGCTNIIPLGLEANSNTKAYTMGYSPSLPSMPLWKTIEDTPASDMPANDENTQSASEIPGNDDNKSKMAEKQSGDMFSNAASISDGDFIGLPDSLFDFSKDEMLFMDVGGKYLVDRSCCNNTLVLVPMDMDDVDTYKVEEKAMMVENFAIATEPKVVTSHIHTILGEEKHIRVKVQKASTSTFNNKSLEHIKGKMFCELNVEDPEIPCNDDIFLLIHPDPPCASSAMVSISICDMEPVSVIMGNVVQGLDLVKKSEKLTQSSSPLQMLNSFKLPELDQVPTVRVETDDICKSPAPRHKAVAPTSCTPIPIVQTNLNIDGKKIDSRGVTSPDLLKEIPLQTETGPVKVTYPETVVKSSTPEPEGPESEIDDPHFSDIEAMILEMDLASYDDDLQFTRQVSRYQQEYSKRKILRLEQCARASIQRAMTSRGALAVLYSRRSRHLIRKTEVILGRSTEYTAVDIDLGKEGCHNKISRYQAIVKMKDDGSFSLKNLAKNPMLVNGTEVGTGELIGLGSKCLIEIRGISFMFESNQKYVNRYLRNIGNKNQGQMAKFDWLPMEDGAMS